MSDINEQFIKEAKKEGKTKKRKGKARQEEAQEIDQLRIVSFGIPSAGRQEERAQKGCLRHLVPEAPIATRSTSRSTTCTSPQFQPASNC